MKKVIVAVALGFLSVPMLTYVSSLYSECCDEATFEDRSAGLSNGGCSWERGDGRCNISSDCCPGRECNSFGMCQSC